MKSKYITPQTASIKAEGPHILLQSQSDEPHISISKESFNERDYEDL